MMIRTCSKHVSSRRAFTLIELLVVITILALLAVIALPAFNKAIEIARRAKCRNNVRQIAEACKTYMNDMGKHRNSPYGNALPSKRKTGSAHPGPNTWSSATLGNPACLWLLVEYDMIGRDLVLCPSAKVNRNHKKLPPGAMSFSSSTLSYSYLSQVEFTDNVHVEGEVKVTAIQANGLKPSELAICADQNPRTRVGSNNIGPINSKLGRSNNSKNHMYQGQNVSFMDGRAKWYSTTVIDGDDIYAADTTRGGIDAEGRRGTINDSFLLP